ncbi:MAG: hypothetical protein HFE63_02470 [Clostridiales bacterium]|nr:hypothetical protein [Clostridiales bacterium]
MRSGQHTAQRTTHPAYKSYSWSTLTRQQPTPARVPQANSTRQRPADPAVKNMAAGAVRTGYADPNARPTFNAGANLGRSVGAANGRMNPAARPKQQTRPAAKANAGAVKSTASAAKKKVAAIKTKSITTLHTIAAEKRYAFPMAIVLIAVSLTILVLAIITTSVRINEITTENAALKREYNSLVADENELRMQLEVRDDLRVVETIAKEELGMVKKDQAQKYYLTIHKEDKIELIEDVVEHKSSFIDGILSFGGSIVERIRAFFGL